MQQARIAQFPSKPNAIAWWVISKIKTACFGELWSMDFILNVPAREGS